MRNYILLLLGVLLFASCSPSITRGTQYAKMYVEKPASILIMPPINRTTSVEAKEYFYTSLAYPLCEKGYYIVSPYLAMDMLQQESAYDSEMFIKGSLTPFREVFEVDAALFTVINSWKKNNLTNNITVGIEYILRSTKTGEILYNRKGTLTVNCKISTGAGGGLLGMVADMAASAINTALTDKVIAARRCNWFVLSDFPAGKYSPLFDKDQGMPAGSLNFSGSVSQ